MHRLAIALTLSAAVLAGLCGCSSDDTASKATTTKAAVDNSPDHQFCQLVLKETASMQNDLSKMNQGGQPDSALLERAQKARDTVEAAAPAAISADTKLILDQSMKMATEKDPSAVAAAATAPEYQNAIKRYTQWLQVHCAKEASSAINGG